MLQPVLHLHCAGDRTALVNPQPSQAKGGHGHAPDVTDLLRKPEGQLEMLPARAQITIGVLRAGSIGKRGLKLRCLVSDQFQATCGHHPARLTRHSANVLAAVP